MPASSTKPFLDPAADVWFTEERKSRLRRILGPASPILLLSGHYRSVFDYWIRSELSEEACSNPAIWPADERQQTLDAVKASWKEQHPNGHSYLTDEQIDLKLTINPGSQQWARYQWGHRIETLYLESKDQLDAVSFWMLRLKDKDLASEIYYSLCAKECGFENVVRKYGLPEDQSRNGYWTNVPKGQLPEGLPDVLSKLQKGQLSSPVRVGKQVALIQLEENIPSRLDHSMEKKLLMLELGRWIDQMIPAVVAQLESLGS